MTGAEVFERYASAAAKGAQNRIDVALGRVTWEEIAARRRYERAGSMRVINRFTRANDERRRARIMGPAVVLDDDGSSDFVFSLLNPDREYRVRAWRYSDGEPVLHRAPGVTIVDLRGSNTHVGTPYGLLPDYGYMVREADTDAWARLWLEVNRLTSGWRVRSKAAGKPK